MSEGATSRCGAHRRMADWEVPNFAGVYDYLVRSGRSDLAEKVRSVCGSASTIEPRGSAGRTVGLGRAVAWGARPQDALPIGERTLIMGVLNVTPDSFSDGGRYLDTDDAVRRAFELIRAGADVLDIGGESTRPGAEPVPAELEIRRVLPVLEALRGRVQVPISIDTYKPEVADAALGAGAHIVNDVTALRGRGMADVIARHGAGVVLMHMKGDPRTMQKAPHYESVVGEILAYLEDRANLAVAAGIDPARVWLDPGVGFGKNLEHNLELLASLRALRALGYPILIGTSRKSFLGHLLKLELDERLEGTAATVALSSAQQVDMVRVHDVEVMARVARTSDALTRGWRHHRVYLGLGTNMGDRMKQLEGAVGAIGDLPQTWIESVSSVYETDPVGVVDQPQFYNMVVGIRTGLDARRLLRETGAIEDRFGRVRTEQRWGPRTLDIDMLLFDDVKSTEPWLTLPHPRMAERAFVLVPLVEIAPDVRWAGRSAKEHLAALPDTAGQGPSSVRRVQSPPGVVPRRG